MICLRIGDAHVVRHTPLLKIVHKTAKPPEFGMICILDSISGISIEEARSQIVPSQKPFRSQPSILACIVPATGYKTRKMRME
jgi:hypothetical protein